MQTVTIERNGWTTTITLDSRGVAHDKWGKFLKVGPGKWQEQWKAGGFPVWTEKEED